jgi:membrane-associated protein
MFDLIPLIKTAGYVGLFAIVFAESGLFIGFFLPGDSLLFTAGFLASQGYLNIWILVPLAFIGAILGDSVGYAFGTRIGPKLFNKEDSLLFNKKHLKKAEIFYKDHGPKTIVIARFLPVIRTFAPIVAGIGNMKYSLFLSFNIIGGVLWGIGMPLLGYWLGGLIPNIDHYMVPIVVSMIVISLLPTFWHIAKEFRARKVRTPQ